MNRKSFGSALQDLHGAPTDTEREAKERKRQQYLNELSEQIRQKKERDEAEKMAREKAKGNEVREERGIMMNKFNTKIPYAVCVESASREKGPIQNGVQCRRPKT